MLKHIKDPSTPRGWTTWQKIDTETYKQARQAFLDGDTEKGESLLKRAVKPLFQANFLWKLLKVWFDRDIAIPFITGYYTTRPIVSNLITTKGKEIISKQLNGVTTAPVTAIAIGIGNTAANAADTALDSEITTNGGERDAATASNQTTTTTGDTARWVLTFSFTGSFAVVEEGLFDNNVSGGNLLARQVFSAVNVVNGDSLQITHNVQQT